MDITLNEFSPEKYLNNLFQQAVECSHPRNILASSLPINRSEAVTVISAGKAAASMAKEFEKLWYGPINGVAVTPYKHGAKTRFIKVIEASHPVPDKNSVKAATAVLKLCENLTKDDLVYVLLSGGGSSLLCSSQGNISLEDKQKINVLLLKCGASINEINTVRKQISKIKGGQLLMHCPKAKVKTLAISDVFDDDPSIIASGPTVIDHSTPEDALNVIKKYQLNTPQSIQDWLEKSSNASDEKSVSTNIGNEYSVIASPEMMLKNIERIIFKDGYDCINLGVLKGEAKTLGAEHAKKALTIKPRKPKIILSGGETTVEVVGNGKGGRNSEYLLSLAIKLNSDCRIYALAADTDGIDGFTDAAGAYYQPDALKDLEKPPHEYLNNNDSYSAFEKINSLIKTGPTQTNVNDFRAVLIIPEI